MRKRILGFALALSGLAVIANAAPGIAHACECLAMPIYEYHSNPKDGAQDVPLTAAPVLTGAFEAGSVTVEDGRGQRVDVVVNEGPQAGGCKGTWAEIIPKQPWGVRTTYIIRVKPLYPGNDPSSITFTTGADTPAEPELTEPEAVASAISGVPPLGGCGDSGVLTCLNVEGQSDERRDIELIARRGDKIVMRTLLLGNDADYGFEALPDCLELRRRSPSGKRSKALMLCDLEPRTWPKIDATFSNLPSCRNGRFEPLKPPADVELRASEMNAAGSAVPEPPPQASKEPERPAPDPRPEASGCAAGSPGHEQRLPALSLLLMAAIALRRRDAFTGRRRRSERR